MLEFIPIFFSILLIGTFAGIIVYENKKDIILFIKFNIILIVSAFIVGILVKNYLIS